MLLDVFCNEGLLLLVVSLGALDTQRQCSYAVVKSRVYLRSSHLLRNQSWTKAMSAAAIAESPREIPLRPPEQDLVVHDDSTDQA